MRSDVEAGSTLEKAMERYPEVFDKLFRAMVRSGEQSGRLEDALDRVAFQVEKADALRRQVKSALMYPILVFGFAAVVLLAVVAFVIPVFVKIFKELAEENPGEAVGLPLPTQICVMASEAITGYWYIVGPLMIFAIFAFLRWKKTEARERNVGSVRAADPGQNRRRDPEGRAGQVVADVRGLGLGRRADAAGDQTDR